MITTRILSSKFLGSAFLGSALFIGGLAGGLAIAQPAHPNLAAAKNLCHQAFAKISAAQTANEWDMQGHAKKAKDLLEQANNELKQAAQSANKNK